MGNRIGLDRTAGRPGFPRAWLLLTAAFLCAVLRSAPAGMPEPPTAAAVQALEAGTHELVNKHRRAMGLSPLACNARIAAVARRHSEDMAAGRGPAGHERFESRRREISNKIPWGGMGGNVGLHDYHPS